MRADCLENMGTSTFDNTVGLHDPLQVWEPSMETSHMLRTSITRYRLRKSVSKQQPDRISMATNKRNMYCCEQCFHLGPPEGSYGEDAVQFGQPVTKMTRIGYHVQFQQ
jgi:hypothetical protein